MHRLLILLFCLSLPALPAAAQDNGGQFVIGSDHFLAGEVVTLDTPGAADVFMAGDILTLAAPITGTAHLAGRRIDVAAAVGANAYAAGMNLKLAAPVSGNASLAGYSVTVNAPVGGNLRAAASDVTLDAPVAGYAMLAGDVVTLNGAVSGDAVLSARQLTFGPDARIDGKLTIYAEKGQKPEVPANVAPADRVTYETLTEGPGGKVPWMRPPFFSWWGVFWAFFKGVVIVALIAAAIAAVAPQRLARLRRRILAAPFRSLWFGFLAQSVAIGATVLLALTLIGLLLVPATLIIALVGGFIGYVVAAYALGVGLVLVAGRPEPATLGARALAALIGALVAGAIALIPFVGWLFVLAAVLAGLGALAQDLFRPAFFTEPRAT